MLNSKTAIITGKKYIYNKQLPTLEKRVLVLIHKSQSTCRLSIFLAGLKTEKPLPEVRLRTLYIYKQFGILKAESQLSIHIPILKTYGKRA